MLNANDLEQLKAKGISEKQIEEQLACFVKGFPFLEIAASAPAPLAVCLRICTSSFRRIIRNR